jgi:hypothetical protein
MESNTEVTTAQSVVEEEKQSLITQRKQLISSFAEAAEHRRSSKMAKVFQQLRQTDKFLKSLERIEQVTPAKRNSAARRYVVSSLFLDECFKLLTADRDEQFFFLTGPTVEGAHVLDQILEFGHAKRNVIGVVGKHADTHRLLIRLEQFGHRLLAHFHSHPGNGLAATSPSGTDTGFQRRLEDAGYPTIAAIFSRDGFIRFFRLDNDLEVEIYGSGVEQHEGNIFRLTATS